MTARLTIEQAATELGAKPRWLRQWLREHPRDSAGFPYYTPVGRDKVFRQGDIDRIELALREGVSCRLNSGRRGKAKRRTSKSEAPIAVSQWRQAAELLNDPSLVPSSSESRSASTSTGNTQRQSPHLRIVSGSQPS